MNVTLPLFLLALAATDPRVPVTHRTITNVFGSEITPDPVGILIARE